MGVALYADTHEIAITTGGTQNLTVNAGKAHANRLYWQADASCVRLLNPRSPHSTSPLLIPSPTQLVFPANLLLPVGLTFHHAYVVYDARVKYMASNAVPLRLR